MPLCPQTLVGPESSARTEGVGNCNGCATCGETVKTTAMTIAAVTCSRNQVGSLYPEQVLLATTGWVPATLSSPPFPSLLGSLCLGPSLLTLGLLAGDGIVH